MLKLLTDINNCYLLHSHIGSDSCSEHWLATSNYSANKFVLRFIRRDSDFSAVLENFRHDAMRYHYIEDASFSDFLEIEYFNEYLFIASQYYGELSLERWMNAGQVLDLNKACQIIMHIAQGLNLFHEKGIIFGGVLPENILVFNIGTYANDFKIRKPGYHTLLPILLGHFLLQDTQLAFLSPEIRASGNLFPSSDIYSLGILLAWFLSGVVPGNILLKKLGKDDGKTLILSTEDGFKDTLPEQIIQIMIKSVLHDPLRRYQNCNELTNDVQIFLQQLNSRTVQPSASSALHASKNIAKNTTTNAIPESSAFSNVAKYFQELSAGYKKIHGIVGSGTILEQREENNNGLSAVLNNGDVAATDTHISNNTAESGLEKTTPPTEDDETEIIPDEVTSLLKPKPLPVSKKDASGDFKQISWQYRFLSIDDFMQSIIKSVRRAHGSKGDFRFIKGRLTPNTWDEIEAQFQEISSEALLVDIGSLARFEKANLKQFLSVFREKLTFSLLHERGRSISRFARLIGFSGAKKYFSVTPLGSLLFGKESDEVETDSEDYDTIIDAMFCFGRQRVPLVLVVRGGECVQPELSVFFGRVVSFINNKPVCMYVFGEDFPQSLRGYNMRGQV